MDQLHRSSGCHADTIWTHHGGQFPGEHTTSPSHLYHAHSLQDDEVAIAHFIGAHMVFLCGTVYMWLQTFISYRIYHASLTRHISSVVIVVRLFIAIMATVTYILSELNT